MKIFTFDATMLNNIACARKGFYYHELNLRPAGQNKTYFDYGDLMHYMLAAFYRSTMAADTKVTARDKAVAAGQEYYPSLDLPVEDCEACIKNFLAYVNYWQNDKWVVKKVEEPFAVEIYKDESFVWADDDTGLTLVAEGKVDLEVLTENGNLTLVDHKTPSRNKDPEKLGNQFPLYCYAFSYGSMIINHVGKQKTLKPEEKFHRYLRFYSQEWLAEFMQETILKIIRWLKDSEQGIYLADFTTCDKFDGCIYRPICEQAASMRNSIIKTYFKQGEAWSPWNK